MKKITSILSLVLILYISSGINAQETKKNYQDSLHHLVTEYYRLNLKIFQKDSNVEDIDTIFKLFTDDFTYVHPKYGGVYKREDLYNGYVRNQKKEVMMEKLQI